MKANLDAKMKDRLFTEMLKSETIKEFRDAGDGIFKALIILGLSNEYLDWSYGKTIKITYEPFHGDTYKVIEIAQGNDLTNKN